MSSSRHLSILRRFNKELGFRPSSQPVANIGSNLPNGASSSAWAPDLGGRVSGNAALRLFSTASTRLDATKSPSSASGSTASAPDQGPTSFDPSKHSSNWEAAMAAAAFALNAKEKSHAAGASASSGSASGDGTGTTSAAGGGASSTQADKEPSFADQLEEYFFQKKGFSNEKWTKHGEELIPAYLKPEHVREAFKLSVQARTVGNHELRKYLKYMDLSEYKNAMEAAKGAQEGGLRLDAETCEVLLSILLRAGQLREALELYQTMIKSRITPHTKSYNHLIQLAVDKQSPYAAHTLFEDMKRKGRSPDVETYELLMQAFALEKPPNWQEAVEIFDKLQSKRSHQLSSSTYNALMKVYLNMTPFDYRIVYNAYYEMRYSRPRIRFGWDSYALVAEAMRRGNAPVLTRMALKIDAWVQIVSLRSLEFWIVATGVVICTFLVRYWIIRMCWFMSATTQSESHVDAGTKVMKMGGS